MEQAGSSTIVVMCKLVCLWTGAATVARLAGIHASGPAWTVPLPSMPPPPPPRRRSPNKGPAALPTPGMARTARLITNTAATPASMPAPYLQERGGAGLVRA